MDYTLSTRQITLRPGSTSLVDVIFRSDSVALERPETVNLRLVPDVASTLPTGPGVFCMDELELTILDTDGELALSSNYNSSMSHAALVAILR